MAEVVQRAGDDAAGAFQLGECLPASVERAGYCTIESVQLRLQIIEVHRWFRKAKDVFLHSIVNRVSTRTDVAMRSAGPTETGSKHILGFLLENVGCFSTTPEQSPSAIV